MQLNFRIEFRQLFVIGGLDRNFIIFEPQHQKEFQIQAI